MPYQVVCCLSFGPVSLDRDFLDLLLTKIRLFLYEKKSENYLSFDSFTNKCGETRTKCVSKFWIILEMYIIGQNQHKTFTLKLRNFQMSFKSNPGVHWSCFTLLCDWSKKLAPPSQPIRYMA